MLLEPARNEAIRKAKVKRKERDGLKVTRLLVIAFALAMIANAALAEPMPTLAKQSGQGTELFAAANIDPLSVALTPAFEAAAAKYDVPVELLETLAYFGSGFENRGAVPNRDGGYGIMALRDNILTGNSLSDAVKLTGIPRGKLITDPAANIEGAAAVLDSYAADMGIERGAALEAWLKPVIKYAGFDDEDNKFFAFEVFKMLKNGLSFVNNEGEQIKFEPLSIGSIDLNSLLPKGVIKSKNSGGTVKLFGAAPEAATLLSSDYGPAIWDPAASCNYSTATHSSDTVVIHVMEGTLAGTRSWFKTCDHGTLGPSSCHYNIGSDGTIVQMVLEAQTAWDCGCYNSRSIGIEHEGYISQSSFPTAMYDASALLTRDICNRRGIPKAHTSCGPGICGHVDVNNCACGPGHTDPGANWNWNYYISKVVGGPKARPAVYANADGRLEAFARGLDGAVWHGWQTSVNGPWSSWASLGGSCKWDPIVTRNSDGRLQVFVVASDGTIKTIAQTAPNGGWGSWINLGGNWPNNCGVGMNGDGRLEVFCRGTTGNLYSCCQLSAGSSSWQSTWNNYGGSFKNDTAVATMSNGRIAVAVNGTDGQIYYAQQPAQNYSLGAFVSLGGSYNTHPKFGVDQDGRLALFVIGSDGVLYQKFQTGSVGGSWYGTWLSRGGNWQHIPATGNHADGRECLMLVGTTTNAYTQSQTSPNGGWESSWTNVGGGWAGDGALARTQDGRLGIFLIGNDPHMYVQWQSSANGSWSGVWNEISPSNIFN